jgi:hypothetical protein
LIFGDCDDLDGVRPRLVEDRSNKVDHEIYRSEIVAVKDELKVIGLGVNIMHRNNPQKTNPTSKIDRLEQNRNYVTPFPAVVVIGATGRVRRLSALRRRGIPVALAIRLSEQRLEHAPARCFSARTINDLIATPS